jgi:hypothetical protein
MNSIMNEKFLEISLILDHMESIISDIVSIKSKYKNSKEQTFYIEYLKRIRCWQDCMSGIYCIISGIWYLEELYSDVIGYILINSNIPLRVDINYEYKFGIVLMTLRQKICSLRRRLQNL